MQSEGEEVKASQPPLATTVLCATCIYEWEILDRNMSFISMNFSKELTYLLCYPIQ